MSLAPLDYESRVRSDPAPPRTKFRPLVLSLAGVLVALLNVSILPTCMCGYMNALFLPGNLVAFALTSVGMLKGEKFVHRLLATGLFIFVSFILFVNIHNVLWSGHNPLLR